MNASPYHSRHTTKNLVNGYDNNKPPLSWMSASNFAVSVVGILFVAAVHFTYSQTLTIELFGSLTSHHILYPIKLILVRTMPDKKETKASKKGDEKDPIEIRGKKFREKKPLPSVQYLLAHGDPETAHLPKTWCEIVGYPVALALVFAISLLIFHHAPHHLAPRDKFTLPKMSTRLPMFSKEKMAEKKMEQQQQQATPPVDVKPEPERKEDSEL